MSNKAGIWTTQDALAEEVVWSPDIEGMANVRVDMLKIRESDNTVLAVTHGRGMFTTEWEVSGSSSIDNIRISENIDVYPNPTEGEFTIEMELKSKAVLKIYDTRGRLVLDEEFPAGNTLRSYNISDEPKGMYLIQLTTKSGIVQKKCSFVK